MAIIYDRLSDMDQKYVISFCFQKMCATRSFIQKSTTPLYHKEIFCHLERHSIGGSMDFEMLPPYVL